MTRLFPISCFICCLFTLIACKSNKTKTPEHSPAITSIFSGDSGYLTKKTMLPYLLSEKLMDTTGQASEWNDIPESSPIAKYYLKGQHYIVCTENADASMLLFETSDRGHIQTHELYIHGSYGSCWHGVFGFGKLGDYFFLRTCNGGTAHNGTTLYLFKEIRPQEKTPYLFECYWQGLMSDNINFEQLNSRINVSHDSIMVHYRKIAGHRSDDMIISKVKTLEDFDMLFLMKDSVLVTTDTTLLKKIWI
ncbi:hypothetical protein SAMN05428949_5478 [Chitinophaga sp. YR627]|uniref:hypothetical protein n=1 Tax=Chitinophaga sp. YR627 TaxID=1881041 RepID=UPI0008E0F71C|nr:hypothetical protein [Chitinophaga sp. YR627]SFO50710.1 hypothetical protein SAMN05428949_5478 [Chitinophaga sp. YR627]